ncbi:MAG: hypothetical protein KJI70_00710 [Patescibacteria group bacterium]|nr:hypothetical protein [Patescibacteria group bacterium]
MNQEEILKSKYKNFQRLKGKVNESKVSIPRMKQIILARRRQLSKDAKELMEMIKSKRDPFAKEVGEITQRERDKYGKEFIAYNREKAKISKLEKKLNSRITLMPLREQAVKNQEKSLKESVIFENERLAKEKEKKETIAKRIAVDEREREKAIEKDRGQKPKPRARSQYE